MSATCGLSGAGAAAQLRRLLHKYELLCWLSQGEPGRTVVRRDALREIAERYPAALREWEQQPAGEIDRRRKRVAERLAAVEAADPAATLQGEEDWLRYGLDVHDCLRAMLQLRRYMIEQAGRSRRALGHGPDQVPAWQRAEGLLVCQALARDCDVPWLVVDRELLAAVALPAGGRLAALAYEAVAERHGTSVALIKAALFGASS